MNAQLTTNLAQGPTMGVQVGCTLNVHGATVAEPLRHDRRAGTTDEADAMSSNAETRIDTVANHLQRFAVGPELPFNPRWSWVAGLGQSKHFGRQKDSVLELWIPLLSGAVGAILGAITGTIGTLITTRRRVDLEQRVAYDKGLQELRLPHYKRLYHLTESFPRRWRPGEGPSRADLRQIGNAFHGWYFGAEPGGIFLTVKGRDVYFTLMNAIMSAGDSTQGAEPISGSEGSGKFSSWPASCVIAGRRSRHRRTPGGSLDASRSHAGAAAVHARATLLTELILTTRRETFHQEQGVGP
jgi:hypothetical protein